MPGFLKSNNRRVHWSKPRFIRGAPYYPIEGARTVVDGDTVTTEYATMNGHLVTVDDDGRHGAVVDGLLRRKDMDAIGEVFPDLADVVLIETDTGCITDLGFRDMRSDVDQGNVWMKTANFSLYDGRWESNDQTVTLIDRGMVGFYLFDDPTREVRNNNGLVTRTERMSRLKHLTVCDVREFRYDGGLRPWKGDFLNTPIEPPGVY